MSTDVEVEGTMAAVDLGAGMVVERLGPWSRARCACINWTWKRAVDEVSFSDVTNQHWLVDARRGTLLMLNILTGFIKEVKVDLPWDSLFDVDFRATWLSDGYRTKVLCSFQGLLLLGLGEAYQFSLVLGDPLANKWIILPSPEGFDGGYGVAAFCKDTRTLMVSASVRTATFDLETAQWVVDPPDCSPDRVSAEQTRACCLDGVFYSTFMSDHPHRNYGRPAISYIACYDHVNARKWKIVIPSLFPVFVAQSHGKMLVYMTPHDGKGKSDYKLFEASKARGSNELELVPSSLMDDEHIGGRIRFPEEDALYYGVCPVFHGMDDFFIWESFHMLDDKVTVLSLKDKVVKQMKSTGRNSRYPCTKCYYAAAPGTCELMNALALKLEKQSPMKNQKRR